MIGWKIICPIVSKTRLFVSHADRFFFFQISNIRHTSTMQCKLFKTCKNKSETDLVQCSLCKENWIHVECYKDMILNFGCEVDSDSIANIGHVCGKRCWNKSLKPTPKPADDTRRVFWHTDGPSEDVNSLSVLIEWLTHEGNYTKWKGGNKHSGVTKNTLASQIVAEIKSKGINIERTAKDVVQKILTMEQNFKKAIDFLDGTGAGITDEESLVAAVKKICPYYYELEPVMSDRQSSRPLATEDDIFYNSTTTDEEEEEEIEEIQRHSQTESQLILETPAQSQTRLDTPTDSQSSKRSSTHLSIQRKPKKKPFSQGMEVGFAELAIIRREQLALDREFKIKEADRMERETKVHEMEAKAKLLDADSRLKEAESKSVVDAVTVKKMEAEIRVIDVESKAQLLLKRKQLSDAGIAQEEIDVMLPLK